MTTPPWLAHYVTASGNPDPRRAGRTARPRTCPRCGRLVLHGADHHRTAAYVNVDPFALSPIDEARAILAGAPTFTLTGDPPAWELNYRTMPGVRAIPGMRRADECVVVAEHSCDRAPYSGVPLATRAPRPTTPDNAIPY